MEQALQDLNLIFCELTSLLLLDVSSDQQGTKRPKRRQAPAPSIQKALPVQIESVCDYVVKTLRGDGPGHSASTASLARPISAASYSSILPTVWALLNNASSTHVDEILDAVVEHAIKTSSKSVVKRLTTDFLGRLLLVRTHLDLAQSATEIDRVQLETEREYRGRFQLRHLSQVQSGLEKWLTQLPKTLWELGAQHLITTEVRPVEAPGKHTHSMCHRSSYGFYCDYPSVNQFSSQKP